MRSAGLYCITSGAFAGDRAECPVHGGTDCLVRGWLQVVPDTSHPTTGWRRLLRWLAR